MEFTMSARVTALIKANWGAISLVVALATSLGTNVWLVRNVGASRGGEAPARIDPTGLKMAAVEAISASGDRVRLEFNDPNETVLYMLAPECSFCVQNYDSIVGLGKSDTKRRYIGIANGVVVDAPALARHLQEKPLPFPVYRIEDTEWLKTNGLTATPTTVVTDRRAQILRFWRGAFSTRRMAEIEAYFGVKLPALSPPRS
jgi:hypothetical protein